MAEPKEECLKYLTLEAYNKLHKNVKLNEEKYFNEEDNSWIKEFLDMENYCEVSSIKAQPFELRLIKGTESDAEIAKIDYSNAIILHKKLRLNRYQASRPLLWTYLTHFYKPGYDYTRNRWQVDRGNTVGTRFFATDSVDTLFYDCALARLWWMVELTYDKEAEENLKNFQAKFQEAKKNNDIAKLAEFKEIFKDPDKRDALYINPYHLTQTLMINQTVSKDILDTLNRNSYNRLKGILCAIREYVNRVGTTKGLIDNARACNREINRDAAIICYDILPWQVIADKYYLLLWKHGKFTPCEEVIKQKLLYESTLY